MSHCRRRGYLMLCLALANFGIFLLNSEIVLEYFYWSQIVGVTWLTEAGFISAACCWNQAVVKKNSFVGRNIFVEEYLSLNIFQGISFNEYYSRTIIQGIFVNEYYSRNIIWWMLSKEYYSRSIFFKKILFNTVQTWCKLGSVRGR